MKNRVDVVIVTYNSASVIGQCLDALQADTTAGVAVIVVDNASSDRTVELAKAHGVGATVISSGGNLGYAGAINIGFDASTAEAIFVLNPDTKVGPGAIDVLVNALTCVGVGIAAPLIRNTAGTIEKTVRRFPSASRLLGQTLIGSHRAGRFEHLGDTVSAPHAYKHQGRHDWCSGAANLISRECWDRVGPWREEFFLYSEETDFAWRAQKLGFETVFVPEAEVQHHGGDSQVSPRLWSILVTNRVRVVKMHRGTAHAALFWAISVVGETMRSIRPRNRCALVALLTGRLDPDVALAHQRAARSTE